jgi:hypothetical protein
MTFYLDFIHFLWFVIQIYECSSFLRYTDAVGRVNFCKFMLYQKLRMLTMQS